MVCEVERQKHRQIVADRYYLLRNDSGPTLATPFWPLPRRGFATPFAGKQTPFFCHRCHRPTSIGLGTPRVTSMLLKVTVRGHIPQKYITYR
jgi:hypothetical protein